MRVALVIASLLILALGVVHSYLGERYIIVRLLRRSDLPRLFGSDEFTRHTLRFAWHLTTVVWLGLALLLLVMARASEAALSLRAVGAVLTATAAVSAVVTVVGSRTRHPASYVFLAIAVLTWVGTR